MNRQEIIAMARESGIEIHERKQQARIGMDSMLGIDSTERLEKFAALVAAKERKEGVRFLRSILNHCIAHDCDDPDLEFVIQAFHSRKR